MLLYAPLSEAETESGAHKVHEIQELEGMLHNTLTLTRRAIIQLKT